MAPAQPRLQQPSRMLKSGTHSASQGQAAAGTLQTMTAQGGKGERRSIIPKATGGRSETRRSKVLTGRGGGAERGGEGAKSHL
eukprot:211992-Chlamydomonas_euryale.AAC.1